MKRDRRATRELPGIEVQPAGTEPPQRPSVSRTTTSSFPVRKNFIVSAGTYDSIEEWEQDEPTLVEAPILGDILVNGRIVSPNHPAIQVQDIDDILRDYLETN